ncbi:hypothetical protein HZB01_00210 [Candidatus Woesearchaeota archaeon]|nr:hypothetical protein [Candidatus Woesearchaeota archaeon]
MFFYRNKTKKRDISVLASLLPDDLESPPPETSPTEDIQRIMGAIKDIENLE